MTKSICFFNHKGGVSKTTTSFNLGWSLADLGYKVLLVDLDSQCNLTGLILGYQAVNDDHMAAFYKSRDNLTMRPVIEALINGQSVDEFVRSETGKLFGTKNKKLFLLPGHLNLSDLDSQISISLKIASGVPATRNIPGNLPKMLQEICRKNSIDYVIYDLSPNIGGLNEVVLMSSDFFIVPTSPDYFCLQAVSSLEKNIQKWHKEIKRFKEANDFSDPDFSIRNRPLFLGAIQQRYRPRHDKPAKSFQKWIDMIRREINDKLVHSLLEIDCVIAKEKIDKALKNSELTPYDLAHIPDFNSLIAISQHLSKPIFSLEDEEIRETGKVFGHAESTMIKSRDSFMGIFANLAQYVKDLTH